jgi:hypothetical protein
MTTTFTKGTLSTIAQGDGRGCSGSAVILTPLGQMSVACRGQFLQGPGILKYLGSHGGVPTYELTGTGSTTISLFRGFNGFTIAPDRVTIALGFALAWIGGGSVPPASGAGFRIIPASYFK